MELGATVCLPNGAPLCEHCPAGDFCTARLEGRTGELPVKGKKKERRVEERTVWLLFRGDQVALRRRPDKGLLAGLWEYPNEPGDGPLPRRGGSSRCAWSTSDRESTSSPMWSGASPSGPWRRRGRRCPRLVWAGLQELRQTYAVPNAFQCCAPLVEQRLGRESGKEARP